MFGFRFTRRVAKVRQLVKVKHVDRAFRAYIAERARVRLGLHAAYIYIYIYSLECMLLYYVISYIKCCMLQGRGCYGPPPPQGPERRPVLSSYY